MTIETGYTGLVGGIRDASRRVVVGACVLFGSVGATTSAATAQSSATVGGVPCIVRDRATKEPAIGATVVASSPALVGEQPVITDETSAYCLSSLPPGLYFFTAKVTGAIEQNELGGDDIYSLDPAMPVVSGDHDDLVHVKALDEQGRETPQTITLYKGYRNAKVQDPRTMQIGVRLMF